MTSMDLKLLSLYTDQNCRQKYYLSYYGKTGGDFKSAKQLFWEVKRYYSECGITDFEFQEPINSDSQTLIGFCKMLRKIRGRVKWSAPLLIRRWMDDKIFREMKSAGCEKIILSSIGISDSLFKKMEVDFTTHDLCDMLRRSFEAGIVTELNLLFGHPGETITEFEEGVKFISENSTFIGAVNLDYCFSSYMEKHYLPGKNLLCRSFRQCCGQREKVDKTPYFCFEEQIRKVKATGNTINLSNATNLFTETLSRYVKPYFISSGAFSAFADLKEKSFRLCYYERELTAKRGVHSCFQFENTWFDPLFAEWQVEKKGEALFIKLFWKRFNFKQTWKLYFKNNVLFWQVVSFLNDTGKFKNFKFGIMLKTFYKKFFCGRQQGFFPLTSSWKELNLDEPLSSRLFGVRKENIFPAVALEKEEKEPFLSIIQSGGINYPCRILQLKHPEDFSSPSAFNFSGKIVFLENEVSIEKYLKEEKQPFYDFYILSSKDKDLTLAFDDEGLHLFWQELKLTKGFGLYTSVFSRNLWQDSGCAVWKVTENDGQKMTLKGKWHLLPLIQTWNLTVKEDRSILWTIEMEILENLIFEKEQQTNLMLSEEYKQWISQNGLEGILSDSFTEEWAPFFFGSADSVKSILVKNPSSRLPSVSLECDGSRTDFFLGILNSSSSFYTRNLKCYKMIPKGKKYLPGQYPYFKGKIKVII